MSKPRNSITPNPTAKPATIAAALAISLGVKPERLARERGFGPQAVEAAHHMRGLSFGEALEMSLRNTGIAAPAERGDIYAEFAQVIARFSGSSRPTSIEAAFSVFEVETVVDLATKAAFAQQFEAVEPSFRYFTRTVQVDDVTETTIHSLRGKGTMPKVAPTGRVQSVLMDAPVTTAKAASFAEVMTLPRHYLVNGDMEALNGIIASMARKAAITIEREVYAKLMEPSDSFYASARGNRLTGSAFSATTLATAEAQFAGLRDSKGEPLFTQPRNLIVPPALRQAADEVCSNALAEDANGVLRPRLRVVCSPYLSSAALAGSSGSTWYLQSSPSNIASLAMLVLRGNPLPIVETMSAKGTFSIDGMRLRSLFDFAVEQFDPSGCLKVTA